MEKNKKMQFDFFVDKIAKYVSNDFATAITIWNKMPHEGVILGDDQIDKFEESLCKQIKDKINDMHNQIIKNTKNKEQCLSIIFQDSTVSHKILASACDDGKFSQTKIPPCSYAMIRITDNEILAETKFSEFDVENKYDVQDYMSSKATSTIRDNWEKTCDVESICYKLG